MMNIAFLTSLDRGYFVVSNLLNRGLMYRIDGNTNMNGY